jgi:cytoskeleton protein RodZ
MWIAAAIAALTCAVYMMPAHWWPFPTSMTPVAPALDAAVPAATLTTAPVAAPTGAAAPTPGSASSAVSGDGESPAAAASESVASAEPDAVAAAAASAILQFRTSAQSWVEVTDSRGQALISRLLEPGESVGVDGVPPLKVSIGNASATQVVFRGQALELASHTRDNVARLDLK